MSEPGLPQLRRLVAEQKKTNQLLTQQSALFQQLLEQQALLIEALAAEQDDADPDAEPQVYMDGSPVG